MRFLARIFDERFMAHRQRSTSIAGMACAAFALLLFQWRLLVDHVFAWDLLAVGATFVVVKVALMVWQRFND